MTALRQPYSELSPNVYAGLVQASTPMEKSSLQRTLLDLLSLLASQNNGRTFFSEMPSKHLRQPGFP